MIGSKKLIARIPHCYLKSLIVLVYIYIYEIFLSDLFIRAGFELEIHDSYKIKKYFTIFQKVFERRAVWQLQQITCRTQLRTSNYFPVYYAVNHIHRVFFFINV